jgi:hypothetical protein
MRSSVSKSAVTCKWYLSLCPPARYSYPVIFMKNIYPNNKQATRNMHKINKSRFNFLTIGWIEKMIKNTPAFHTLCQLPSAAVNLLNQYVERKKIKG